MRRPGGPLSAAVAGLVGAGLLASCGSSGTLAVGGSTGAPQVTLPLATSSVAGSSVWTSVAMGHLDDPLNTFWQLLRSPNGRVAWVDESTATATATNGGIVLSGAGTRLTAGVIPSQELTYSPLVSTTDNGKTWTTGVLPGGLAPVADALSVDQSGDGVALLQTGSTTEVVTTPHPGDLTTWTTVVTEPALAATSAGGRCGVTAIDAVAQEQAGSAVEPVVGATCTGAASGSTGGAAAGIFVDGPSGGSLAGPPASDLPSGAVTQVVALRDDSAGLAGLVAVDRAAPSADNGASSGPESQLVPVWLASGTTGWKVGPPLPLTSSDGLQSVVIGPSGQIAVLQKSAGGPLQLKDVTGPGRPWTGLASPPAGTATVAWSPAGPVALSVARSTLTASAVGPTGIWAETDTLDVTIEYGSSG